MEYRKKEDAYAKPQRGGRGGRGRGNNERPETRDN